MISDYVKVFIDENTVYPEDLQLYLKGLKDFYENDISTQEPIRFSIGGRIINDTALLERKFMIVMAI